MSHLTRRSFLEHTLAAASAGLAATSFAYGDDVPQAEDKSKKTSPSNRIGLAVIGLHGRGTDAHVDAFSYDDNVEIVAICDVDTAQFAKAQNKLKERGRREAKTYQDLRQLFEDKDVQAVSIATPNHWHSLAGVWAMQSGHDVYVEKPVSHEVTEGRRLEEARVKYNRICQAGTQSRSNRATQEAIKYVEDGHIGKVLLSRALCYKRPQDDRTFLTTRSAPETLNYDIWQGPAAGSVVQQESLPLRMALELGLRQRRHRQPGRSPDGYRSLGIEENPADFSGEPRRPLRIQRRRRDPEHDAHA